MIAVQHCLNVGLSNTKLRQQDFQPSGTDIGRRVSNGFACDVMLGQRPFTRECAIIDFPRLAHGHGVIPPWPSTTK